VVDVASRDLVLALVPHLRLERGTWFLVASMWLVFLGAWALFNVLGRALGWSRERVGALTLVAGLGNTSFMGYPMIEALHGKAGLTLAVLADQLGCFPLLAAGGITVASLHSGRKPSAALVVRRVVTFPAFIALGVGLVVHALGGWPAAFEQLLLQIGQTLTPLALFSVGLQLRLHLKRDQLGALGVGLGWKLLLAPLLCWGLGLAFGVSGLTLTVGVLQSAMAPMISATILADQFGLEPRLTNSLLGAGILLSLATVPLANAWLP
jgi:predicted permease